MKKIMFATVVAWLAASPSYGGERRLYEAPRLDPSYDPRQPHMENVRPPSGAHQMDDYPGDNPASDLPLPQDLPRTPQVVPGR
jgi:hypothetical protein